MTSINSKQAPHYGIGNSLVPVEGPVAIPLDLNFANDNSGFVVAASNLFTNLKGVFSMLQCLWVDTSGTDSPLVIAVQNTFQNLTIPGRTQGFVGIVAPNDWTLNITCADANADVKIALLNYAVAGHLWKTQ